MTTPESPVRARQLNTADGHLTFDKPAINLHDAEVAGLQVSSTVWTPAAITDRK